MEILKHAPWSRIRGQNSVNKEVLETVGNGKLTGSVRNETYAASVTISISVQNRHSRIRLPVLSCNRMKRMRREPEVPEARVPVVECLDGRARITSKELFILWKVASLQNAGSTSPRKVADLVKSALVRTARLKNSLAKRFKKNGDKSAGAMLKITRQLGCVFQDMESPKYSSILRKSSHILKPIRCVQVTKAVFRHANIRDQKPSLGIICPGDPHQRNPNAPKFEDRSQTQNNILLTFGELVSTFAINN